MSSLQHKTLFYKMIFKVHNEEENYIQDFIFLKALQYVMKQFLWKKLSCFYRVLKKKEILMS